jgi:predicted nucleotidyltransferase
MTQSPNPMNNASLWRFTLAQRIAASYARNPKVVAIQVAGSVGRGTADRYSDIEIDVYYAAPPTVAERRAAVAGCGALLDSLDEDADEWEEQMLLDGVHAATSTFLVSTLERYLREVVDEAQIAPAAQTRLFSLQHAVPLLGHEWVEQWRARAAHYPPALTEAMLREHLPFRGFGYGEEMLAARGDVLLLYRIFGEIGRQLIGALHGLNRRYLATPDGLKWMEETLAAMPIQPPATAARLKTALRSEPVAALRGFKELCAETLRLVETHLPTFDTTPYWATFHRQRQVWDGPPAALSELARIEP